MKNERNVKDDGTKLTEEEVKQEMLEHLSSKYQMEFECFTIQFAWWGQQGYEYMLAYPKGENPNFHFPVYRYYHEDDSVSYQDGYIGHKMEPIFKNEIEEIISNYAVEGVIRAGYNLTIYPEAMPVDISYEQFKMYTDQKVRISIGLFTNMSIHEAENIIDSLANDLEKEFRIGSFAIAGYNNNAYQTHIVNDVHNILHMGGAFSDKGKEYSLKRSWGNINQSYQYVQEKN